MHYLLLSLYVPFFEFYRFLTKINNHNSKTKLPGNTLKGLKFASFAGDADILRTVIGLVEHCVNRLIFYA